MLHSGSGIASRLEPIELTPLAGSERVFALDPRVALQAEPAPAQTSLVGRALSGSRNARPAPGVELHLEQTTVTLDLSARIAVSRFTATRLARESSLLRSVSSFDVANAAGLPEQGSTDSPERTLPGSDVLMAYLGNPQAPRGTLVNRFA